MRPDRHRLPREGGGPGHDGGAPRADRVGRAVWRTCSSSSPAASGSISSIRSSRAEVARRARPSRGSGPCSSRSGAAALARLRQQRSGSWPKVLLLALVGGVFWTGIFGIAYRVLSYIQRVADIGDLLAGKMLSIILLAFLTILLLSNVITALSTFFLAKDLDLLVAAPVGGVRIYLAKLSETVVHSSWMVALLALPILSAYGIVYHGGPLFPLVAAGAFLPFLVLPAVVGVIVTMLLVNVFPARRTRELLGLIGLGRSGRRADPAPGDSARAAGPSRGVPEFPGLPRGAADADQPTPAERVGHLHDHELAAPGGRPAAGARALGLGGACALALGASRTGALPLRLLQGAGGWRAEGAAAPPRPARRGPRPAAAGQARVHAQGPAALLPRQYPVEPADSARRSCS